MDDSIVMAAMRTDPNMDSRLSFVVLYHAIQTAHNRKQIDSAGTVPNLPSDVSQRGSHWDLMLQHGDVLRTWSLPDSEFEAGPFATSRRLTAQQLPDHRLAYLQFEGDISGDRGHVRRWESGRMKWTSEASGSFVVELFGPKLRGSMQLRRNVGDQFWVVSLV